MSNCLNDATLAAFADGTLGDTKLECLEEHIDTCSACRSLVADLGRAVGPAMTSDARARVGPYLIVDLIGAGAMGTVYAAYDPRLDRKIALKIVRARSDDKGQDRLLREARAAARLQHRNVVTVFEAGIEDECLFLATELIDGVDLATWLQTKREPQDVLRVFAAAARGLHAAHEAGIVHRDFKPANVLVAGDGRVAVADFGVATSIRGPSEEAEGGASRATEGMSGTPAFFSPERLAGAEADPRADQFAFAVALWEALSGRHPFASEKGGVDIEALKSGRISRKGVLPDRLESIVRRGLRGSPADRFPTMEAFADALDAKLRAPRRRRRLAIVLAAAATGGAMGLVLSGNDGGPSCDAIRDRSVQLWTESRQERARLAFAATKSPKVEQVFVRAASALDAAAGRWESARLEVCHDSSKDPADSALLARASCLESRYRDVQALGALFEAADAAVVKGATRAIASLTGIDCTSHALVIPAPPSDPIVRAQVAELDDALAASRARFSAADYQHTLRSLDEIAVKVEATKYQPLIAEFHHLRGDSLRQLGRADESIDALNASIAAGERGGHDIIRARALTGLSIATSARSRPHEGLQYIALARAALERAGGDDLFLANIEHATALHYGDLFETELALEHEEKALKLWRRHESPLRVAGQLNQASLLRSKRRFTEAEPILWATLADSETLYGADHPHTAAVLSTLGNNLAQQGRDQQALEPLLRALEIQTSVRGNHPSVAQTHLSIGNVFNTLSQFSEALKHFDECTRTLTAIKATEHFLAGYCLIGEASTNHRLGNAASAVVKYEKALAIAAVTEQTQSPAFAEARHGLALALWDRNQDGDQTRALGIAKQALVDYKTSGDEEANRRLEAWLKEKGGRRLD